MQRQIVPGSDDVSLRIRILDSTDGTPETGVTSATTGLSLSYVRDGATATSITVSDLTALTDAHSDGGILHISDGYYRLDVADAAFASGADSVMITGTATGMVIVGCEVQMSNQPVNVMTLRNSALDSIKEATADQVWAEALADHSGTAGSTAEALADIDTATQATQTDLATAQADLDIITGTNGVVIDDNAITAGKFDETTAFPLKSDDSGSTQVARVGADSDTLETLSDQLDGIAASTSLITSATELTVSVISSGDVIDLTQGASSDLSFAIDGTIDDLTGITVKLGLVVISGVTGEVTAPTPLTCTVNSGGTANQTVTVTVPAATTADMAKSVLSRETRSSTPKVQNAYRWSLISHDYPAAGKKTTHARGYATVQDDDGAAA